MNLINLDLYFLPYSALAVLLLLSAPPPIAVLLIMILLCNHAFQPFLSGTVRLVILGKVLPVYFDRSFENGFKSWSVVLIIYLVGLDCSDEFLKSFHDAFVHLSRDYFANINLGLFLVLLSRILFSVICVINLGEVV